VTPLRVLVAEGRSDHLLADIIEAEPTTELIAAAATGRQAIALTERFRPDAILLTSNLTSVDAFTATREIMTATPTPIVMVVDEHGELAERACVKAREAGALAAIPSPPAPGTSRFAAARDEVLESLRAMAAVGLVRRRPQREPIRSHNPTRVTRGTRGSTVVAIGASTGGPAALRGIFAAMPADFSAPILVTQHISAGFSEGMVFWLNAAGPLRVKIAEHGEALCSAVIYVAPDDRHLTISADRTVELSDAAPNGGHRPSANVMFRSVAERYAASAFAVILTGMGRDGVDGLEAVHRAGGVVCAQDEASSAVFGMPRAAIEAGVVDLILPLHAIPRRIADAVTAS
jgi:two-component system, chemotaxis family, protein-glutamate methylesterase/glutaminase